MYDTDKAAYIMPAGEYTIFAGTDVYAPIWGSFVNEAETIVKQASHLMMAPNPPETLSKRNPESWPKGERTRVKGQTVFSLWGSAALIRRLLTLANRGKSLFIRM